MAERDKLVPVGFRLSEETIDRIDEFRKSQHLFKRSEAVRVLIERALVEAGFGAKPKKKARRRR